jgi:hypothetical protein
MSSSRDPLTTAVQPSAPAQLASWYAQGPSDGLGDRLLMFDNAATGPLELLRVRADFAAVPRFEPAVRERFDRLAAVTHRGLATARGVNHLEQREGLTVVSTHVPGTRLSELFQAVRPHSGMHPASARWALGELITSLAELHRQEPDIAHGALSLERIVIAADRRLVITDYVFGAALRELRLSPDRLWTEFGVAVPSSEPVAALDQHTDVVQVASIVIALVLGRRVLPRDLSDGRAQLLDEFSAAAESRDADATPPLREWLERALSPVGFSSAVDAELGLVLAGLLTPSLPAADRPEPTTVSASPAADPLAGSDDRDVSPADDAGPASAQPMRRLRPVQWAAAALALLAIFQGGVIVRLLTRVVPDAKVAAAAPRSARDTPNPTNGAAAEVRGPEDTRAGEPVDASSQAPDAAASVAPGSVLAITNSAQRGLDPTLGTRSEASHSSGIRIVSPVTMQVVEGEHVLGSTASGAVFTTPGVHHLDLINNALGYRTTQTIRVPAGRVIPLHIDPPNGSVSLNARPWAQVWIDGAPVGETPLVNMAVPLGEHEVVFRHPQLGERRQKAIVRAGAATQVSVSFER